MDTNPDRPSHWLKTDYIDKADGKTIQQFHWELTDNTFLNDRYIESIKASTPSGVFYDRDILGMWVSASGVVYPDFSRERHFIHQEDVPEMARYFAGVDFGWEHTGAIVLCGEDADGHTYLLREWSAKHRSIDDWIKIVKEEIQPRTGEIILWCDSARPDLINEMQCAGLDARNAHKDVIAGIGEVATLFKTDRLHIVEEGINLFNEEIDTYVWKDNEDAPVKDNDDVLDAMRYAIYSDKVENMQTATLVQDLSFNMLI